MNDLELERRLQSIGKKCFVTFFENFATLSYGTKPLPDTFQKIGGVTNKPL